MGIGFLKHIERCQCLLYVIDMSQPNPQEQMECLTYELEQYLPGLSKRPHGIIANKMDLESAKGNLTIFGDTLLGTNIIAISAKQNENIDSLLYFIRQMCEGQI